MEMQKADVYEISNDGEYGRFYLIEGRTERGNYWCELTCNTSFGVVGYSWGHMGSPAAKFFSHDYGNGYFANKLWATDTHVFSADTARDDVRRLIDQEFADHMLTHPEWEERTEQLDNSSFCNEFEWHQFVIDTDWLYTHLLEGGGPMGKEKNPQMVGFFRHLWPQFLSQLKQQSEAAA